MGSVREHRAVGGAELFKGSDSWLCRWLCRRRCRNRMHQEWPCVSFAVATGKLSSCTNPPNCDASLLHMHLHLLDSYRRSMHLRLPCPRCIFYSCSWLLNTKTSSLAPRCRRGPPRVHDAAPRGPEEPACPSPRRTSTRGAGAAASQLQCSRWRRPRRRAVRRQPGCGQARARGGGVTPHCRQRSVTASRAVWRPTPSESKWVGWSLLASQPRKDRKPAAGKPAWYGQGGKLDGFVNQV